MIRRLPLLACLLVLVGCAGAPEQPTSVRQALLGLSERAAEKVTATPPLPHPAVDEVLLLAMPQVDARLPLADTRLLESLTRALLAIDDGPQVLEWRAAMAEGSHDNQWRLETRLSADGPRLQLSDRELLPYRLSLVLRRTGHDEPVWRTEIEGALDATAL
ncbi:hypothetical protein FEI13_00585 [Halomonas urmiana]|uniref:Penicillin-binding protein activator LpoB n=1 Tax=Halomonas urmiana TaxID=490901 RepID=A0A5R8MN02_9GAMM|nr:hypothetical protein [Halomonas urmiana]TLF53758.1 hypothetical protein FEI13_00585 [Halomonas urmiana]